jgi:asparagine synthase (glutamine-hydrolysing)
MCGIAGYVGNGSKEMLERMTNALIYRGPDGSGYYEGKGVGFGHRRLSIIDVSLGNQPLFNEDGTVAVVFNGEIYNYQVLKDELVKKGHHFVTHSDTEVIAHLYEEEGEKLFIRLNGMFAIAIWDAAKELLLLGRDRYGQKPLYWFRNEKVFLFGSEPKALLLSGQVPKEVAPMSLRQFFYFDYIPGSASIWKNVFKLEAGSYLVLKNNQPTLTRYYDFRNTTVSTATFEEAKTALTALLSKGVKSHLMSEVPIGIFLSGGIDSSTIAYFAAQHHPGIKTFSIGFKEKSYDESEYAHQVADRLHTEHYHKECTADELVAALPKVVSKIDEPFGDASILPTYLLSAFARQEVTVALGGDGGDELFFGYPNHKLHRLVSILPWLQKERSGQVLKMIAKLFRASDTNLPLGYKLERLAEVLRFRGRYRDFLLIGGYDQTAESLQLEGHSDGVFDFADTFLKELSGADFPSAMALQLLRYYLTDDILYKVDRAAMYSSLEVRAPFLDISTAEFALSLPASFKLRRGTSKYILKEAMRGKLPSAIIDRSKKGFGIPIGQWFKKELREYLISTLSPESLGRFGLLNVPVVQTLITEHLNNRRDHRKILWKLSMFQEWCTHYLV